MKSANRIFAILFCCAVMLASGLQSAIAEEPAWESTKDVPVYNGSPADKPTDAPWNSTKDLSTLPEGGTEGAGEPETVDTDAPAVPADITATPEDYAGLVDADGNAGYGGPWDKRRKIEETIYYYPGFRWTTNNRWTITNDFIIPMYRQDWSAFFINPRVTFDGDGGSDMSFGLGYRHMLGDAVILGGNLYYDTATREYEDGLTGRMERQNFNQLGAGVEVLTNWVNLRVNGYLHLSGDAIINDSYQFEGPGIWGSGSSVTEALSGFDGELGFKIPGLSNYVETWVYGGGYMFWGEELSQVNGYRSRIEIVPMGLVRLNVAYSNDPIDGDQIEGSLALEIPFSITNLTTGKDPFEGMTDRLVGSRTLKERLVEPVSRGVDMPMRTQEFPSTSGLVEEVVFVSESAAVGSGDGSFENPYATILEAMADGRITGGTAHTIHIINDSTTGTVEGGGTVSVGSLMVWGSGVRHPVYGNIINVSLGYPTVSGTLGLNAADLTVTGLHIDVAGTSGVDIYDTTGLAIINNIIDVENAGTTYGIYAALGGDFGSAAAPVQIYNNYINVTATGAGNQAFGMYLVAGGNMFGEITGNRITSVSDSNLQENTAGIFIGSAGGNIGYDGATFSPFLISGNTINATDTGDLYGVILFTPGGGTYANVLSNEINLTNPDPATGNPDWTQNDWIIPLGLGWRATPLTNTFYTSLHIGSYSDNVPVAFRGNRGTITSNQANYLFMLSSSDSSNDYFITGSTTDIGYMGDNSITADHWDLSDTSAVWMLYVIGWSGHYVPGTIP